MGVRHTPRSRGGAAMALPYRVPADTGLGQPWDGAWPPELGPSELAERHSELQSSQPVTCVPLPVA